MSQTKLIGRHAVIYVRPKLAGVMITYEATRGPLRVTFEADGNAEPGRLFGMALSALLGAAMPDVSHIRCGAGHLGTDTLEVGEYHALCLGCGQPYSFEQVLQAFGEGGEIGSGQLRDDRVTGNGNGESNDGENRGT